MPVWQQVYQYSLFSFDAAGLLTILGADEVNLAVGRLVRSKYLEFMPLLAPFVVTGDRFTRKIAGYQFYNITDGINLEINSGWLVRYLISQDENIEHVRSILKVKVLENPRSPQFENLCALVLGGLFFGALTTLAVLAGDWWGLASTVGVAVSVIVRNVLLEANRRGIDASIVRATGRYGLSRWGSTVKKVLIMTPDDKCVTMLIPGHLMIPLVSQNPAVQRPRGYKALRYSGWIAFISHIVAINQACFAVKVITTVSLVVSTIMYTWKFGCTDSTWFWQRWKIRSAAKQDAARQLITAFVGTQLKLELIEYTYEFRPLEGTKNEFTLTDARETTIRSQKRQDLYAWLQLKPDEEVSMGKWDLLPHVRNGNETWWETYEKKKQLMSDHGLDVLALYNNPTKEDNGTAKETSLPSIFEEEQSKGPKRTSTVLIEEGTVA